ncbi:hypothetical protein SALBM311S_02082 [Streptomyces alboniger]
MPPVASAVTAPLAHATPLAVGPGDNGTVKIHDATTGEELRRNEPHVCTFYLDAFGFDAVQQVDWHIEAWAPTADVKGETVKSGEIALDSDGHGRTGRPVAARRALQAVLELRRRERRRQAQGVLDGL